MAKNWNLKCEVCETKMSFVDAIDIKQSHWTILAWDMSANMPRVVCANCEYPINKIKKKYD